MNYKKIVKKIILNKLYIFIVILLLLLFLFLFGLKLCLFSKKKSHNLECDCEYHEGQQIVVMKGWEGFADRLQVLSHCLNYCIVHKAAICIDWRDEMWGQKTLDFSDYFEIIGIPVVTLSDVITLVKKGASVYPTSWNLETIESVPNETTHFEQYKLTFNNDYKRIQSQILINNTKAYRVWHLDNLISNIRIKKSVADVIISRLKNLERPYTVIHLRGTDRLSDLSLEDSINHAVEKINLQPDHALKRMYVISDMKSMIDLWKIKFPQTKKVYNDSEIHKLPNEKNATHHLSKEMLEFYNIKKHNMNIDTITDFLTICFTNWSVGNSKESTFTALGKFMNQGGALGVSKWLHGFYPINKNL
jgi:hypothetical protein